MGLLGRGGAVLAAAAAAAHAALAVVDPSSTALLMLPLAAACAVCARHLWCGATARTWVACAVLDTTMLALMLLWHAADGSGGGSAGGSAGVAVGVGMQHGGSPLALGTPSPEAAAVLMAAGTLLVAAQLVLTAAVGAGGAARGVVRSTGWVVRNPVGRPGPG